MKMSRYLQTRRLEKDLLDPFRSLDEIRAAYLVTLQSHIRSILVWILNASYEPGKLLLPLNRFENLNTESSESFRQRLERCEEQRATKVVDLSYNQVYFATISIWYVLKFCPEAATDQFKNEYIKEALNKLKNLGDMQDSWGDRDSTPKNDVLQWFHLSCLLLIYQQSFGQDKHGKDVDGYQITGLNRQDLHKAQQRCQKFITRLQKNQSEHYSMEHEELDRLVLLGEELGLQSLPASSGSSNVASARAKQTRTRIYERKRTTRFNPGPKAYYTGKISEMASNAPWELGCLNHHSQLRIAAGWDHSNQYSIHSGRDRCFEFLLSDYTFMTSWDRADNDMVGKWWDLEPGSIISATIIDLKTEGYSPSIIEITARALADHYLGKLESAKEDLIEDLSRSKTAESFISPIERQDDQDTASRWDPAPAESFQDLILQLKQVISQNDPGTAFPSKVFDWMTYKPDKLYHPPWWIQSLDDTPENYKWKQTKDVPLRREILRYLTNSDTNQRISAPEWTIGNIEREILPMDVQFMSLFDLRLNDDFTFSAKSVSLTSTSQTTSPANSVSSRSRVNRQSSMEVLPKGSSLESHQKGFCNQVKDSGRKTIPFY